MKIRFLVSPSELRALAGMCLLAMFTAGCGDAPAPSPLEVRVDNSQVRSLARNGHSESLEFMHKAVNVRVGCLRDYGTLGWIRMGYVPSKLNKSNLFTKEVKPFELHDARRMLGLCG